MAKPFQFDGGARVGSLTLQQTIVTDRDASGLWLCRRGLQLPLKRTNHADGLLQRLPQLALLQ